MEHHWSSKRAHGRDWWRWRAHERWSDSHGWRRRRWRRTSHVVAHAHWWRATIEGRLVCPSSPGTKASTSASAAAATGTRTMVRRPSGRGSCAIAPPATSVIMVPLGTPPPAATGMVPASGSTPVGMVSWRVLATATAPGGLVAAVMAAVLLRTGGVGDGRWGGDWRRRWSRGVGELDTLGGVGERGPVAGVHDGRAVGGGVLPGGALSRGGGGRRGRGDRGLVLRRRIGRGGVGGGGRLHS